MMGAPLALLAALQMPAAPPAQVSVVGNVDSTVDAPSEKSGDLFGTEAYLGLAVLGSLAVIHIEGLDFVDEVFRPQEVGADRLSRTLPRSLGSGEVVASLAGGLLLTGYVARSPALQRSGWRSLEAFAVSAIGTSALKIAIGRSRPGGGREEDVFHPFRTTSDSWSFPSGHTSSAFALATAVSMELGPKHGWVPFVAYPLAAWAGASRVVDERHWPTDVLAGAAVGILSARLARSWFGFGDTDGAARLVPITISTPDGPMFGVRLAIR